MATLVAVFDDAQTADRAASDLAGRGFSTDNFIILGGDPDIGRGKNVPPSSFVGIQAQQIPGLETGVSTSPGASGLGQGEAIGGADEADADLRTKLVELGVPRDAAERYTPLLQKGNALLVVTAEQSQVGDARQVLNAADANEIDRF